MSRLDQKERDHFLIEAETSFIEFCTLQRSSGETQDEYGQVTHSVIEYENVECGIKYFSAGGKVSFENEVGQTVILAADALLRVSLSQGIGVNDFVIVRNKKYNVDGIYDGMTVRFAVLKSLETEEYEAGS